MLVAKPGPSRLGPHLTLWALLLVSAALSVGPSRAAGLRWPPPPMPFPPRPRQMQQQLLGRAVAAAAHMGALAGPKISLGDALEDSADRRLAAALFNEDISPIDVTPEERMIDQLNALLQRTQGRPRKQQQSMLRAGQGRPADEEEDEEEVGGELMDESGLEAVLEEAGLLLSPPPAREGRGPGFTYRFPERGEAQSAAAAAGRYFAVNPSDPKYYTATAIGRGNAWGEEEEEGGAELLEGGGGPSPPQERPRPMGRFPVVKPIKVISTSGTDIPPLHSSEENDVDILDTVDVAKGSVAEKEGKKDKGDLRMAQHEGVEHRDKDTFIIPAEQVKRERPDKVPLDFGSDAYLTAIISGCTAAVVVGILAFAIFWYRLQRNAKAAADVEYPAYGVTGPNQEASAVAAAAAAASSVSPTPHSGGSTSPLSAGDRRLAQSAQMYHYQHQKQQIIAMESRASNERRGSVSEVDSEEENEEGDYTVYECPGLAPTGEMEVKNPLFHDDPTPATPSGGSSQRGDGGGGKP